MIPVQIGRRASCRPARHDEALVMTIRVVRRADDRCSIRRHTVPNVERPTIQIDRVVVFQDALQIAHSVDFVPDERHFAIRADALPNDNRAVARNAKRSAVDRVIEEVGLTQMKKRLIKKLSKGFRQRVGLAQALVNNPEVLILDEPTVGLDPKQITDIRSLIKHLAGDRTVILSTHILPEVSMTCDKVTIINQGRIVVSDTLANLTKRGYDFSEISIPVRDRGKDTAGVLRGLNGVTSVKAVELTTRDDTKKFDVSLPEDADLRGMVAKAITSAEIDLLEMTSRQVSLEEIFIRHITKEENHSAESPAESAEQHEEEKSQ